MDPLVGTFRIAGAAMKAQGTRLRVISENIANADSRPEVPGGEPYRRKTVVCRNALDRALGVDTVGVKDIRPDRSSFRERYQPGHPAANADGYVQAPNVEPLVEMMDMRQAQRSYEANLGMIRTARDMVNSTIDVLR